MTTTMENRTTSITQHEKNEILFRQLFGLIRDFERSQASVRIRFDEIRNGDVKFMMNRRRTPTKTLMGHRDLARRKLRDFFDSLSEEEQTVIAISNGDKDWRASYEELMDPTKDPVI